MQGSSGDASRGLASSRALDRGGPGGRSQSGTGGDEARVGLDDVEPSRCRGARRSQRPFPEGFFFWIPDKIHPRLPPGGPGGGGRPPGGPRGGPGGPGGPPGLGTHLGLGSCLHRHQRKRRGRQTKRRGRQRQRRGRRRWPGSTAGRRWRPSSPPTGVPSTEKSRRSIPSPHTPGYGGNPGWF